MQPSCAGQPWGHKGCRSPVPFPGSLCSFPEVHKTKSRWIRFFKGKLRNGELGSWSGMVRDWAVWATSKARGCGRSEVIPADQQGEGVVVMGITRVETLGWPGLPHQPDKMAQRQQEWGQQQLYFICTNCKGCSKFAYMHVSHTRQFSLDNCKGESKLNGN